MKWNKYGVTREVFITTNYAFKLPKFSYGWKSFLQGLLANMQEVSFSKTNWPELCPIVFYIPGGWLVVMKKVEPLTDYEWENFNVVEFCNKEDYVVPAEYKQDSFGKLNGSIVAVDYGNDNRCIHDKVKL